MRKIAEIDQATFDIVCNAALAAQAEAERRFGRGTGPYFRFCYDAFEELAEKHDMDEDDVAESILFPSPIEELNEGYQYCN